MMTRSDRTVRVLLGAIAFLLAANLIVQINQAGTRQAMAAGLPDSGAQLQAQIDLLTKINDKVDKMESYLESGNLSVKVSADKSEK